MRMKLLNLPLLLLLCFLAVVPVQAKPVAILVSTDTWEMNGLEVEAHIVIVIKKVYDDGSCLVSASLRAKGRGNDDSVKITMSYRGTQIFPPQNANDGLTDKYYITGKVVATWLFIDDGELVDKGRWIAWYENGNKVTEKEKGTQPEWVS